MNIKILNPVPIDFWQQIAGQCSWATFFHTPGWSSVLTETFPEFTMESIGFITQSGARGVIPFLAAEKKRLFKTIKKYRSMEPGVYGGIIADGEIGQEEIDYIIQYITSMKHTEGRIIGNPFKNFAFSPPLVKKEMSTYILDLSPGIDAIWKKFGRGQKSNIMQAGKKGVTIRRAESLQDIEHYGAIYDDTLERWGEKATIRFPQALFTNLFRTCDPHSTFWLAEKEGQIIAGIPVLQWSDNLIYWHGCSLQEFFKYYPNNLLHYTVIQWAYENNVRYYDMGPSLGMEGLLKFKKSFGAENVPFSAYRWGKS